MLDAYGGMTIGGAGFEVDGNGIFPYTRLTSSSYIANNQQFYLLGLLDNAYHPTTGGWECDNNNDWAWFVGLKFPHKSETYMHKDTQNASFVIMYNDMASADKSKEHNLNPSDWHIVFEVDKTGAKGSGGGGGSSDVYPSDNTPLTDTSSGSAGLSNDYSRADHRHPLLNAYPPETHNHDDRYYQKSYIDSIVPSQGEIPTPTKRYPLEDVAGGNVGEIEDEYALADHQHELSSAYAPAVHNHDDRYHTKSSANSTFATKQEMPVPTNLISPKDSRYGNKGASTEYARADHSHPMATDIYAPRWSFDELYTLVHAINSQLDRLNVGYYKYNDMPEYDGGEDNALYIDYNDSSHSLDFYNWEEDSSSGTLRHILVKIASLPLQQYDQWERITGTDFLGDGKLYVNKAIRMAEFTWTYTNSSVRAEGDEQGYRLSNVPSQYCPVASFITGIAHNGGATIRVDSSGVITIRFLKAYNTTSRDFHFSLQWHY